MKLLRFGLPGDERPGLLDGDGLIRDLSAELDDIADEALLPDALERIRRLDVSRLPTVEPGVRIGPCVGSVGKFVCIGLNYTGHASESKMEMPEEPVLFMKATSAISGPYDDVVLPPGSPKGDWEVELGVVIGAPAKRVSGAEAAGHIAGYCLINDLSDRRAQLDGTGQWVKGKSADTFGPIGPWLVTPDEIADPHGLDIWLEVDGYRHQDGNTSMMVVQVPDLIAYVSDFMSLQPGDIISTGTPPGVGLGYEPPQWLQAGNVIRLGIEGLGEQRQLVVEGEDR